MNHLNPVNHKNLRSFSFLFILLIGFVSADRAWTRTDLLTCSTLNGLEIIVETRGKSSGIADYDRDIWTLAPDEYVSVELAANVICDRMEIRQLEYSAKKGKLKFLCLRSGDSAYFEIPLTCKK